MLKKLVLAAAIGMCALAPAQAAPLYHVITATYTGLADYNTGEFDPARTGHLRAVGVDRNKDGGISVEEVIDFSFSYVSIDGYDIRYGGRCGYQDRTSWCLKSFSYKEGEPLTFDAWRHSTYDEAWTGSSVTSGQSAYSYFQYTWGEGNTTYNGFRWTPDTQTSISLNITPVPEPAAYAMLGAGLCAVGAIVRRRRKQLAA